MGGRGVAAGASAGASGAAPAAAADAGAVEVPFGTVGPISGGIAHIGKDVENGVRLALDEANAAGVKIGGARQVECTINGLGERAGNSSLEEIVMAVRTRRDHFGLEVGIDTTQIVPASRMVSQTTGFVVQPNKAVVGANAFAHESGIHQHGMLRHAATYEIMRPQDVGLSRSHLVLGKHSGRHAFRERVRDRLRAAQDHVEMQMDILRQEHHAETFRVLLQDLQGLLSVEHISDRLSDLADAMLDRIMQSHHRLTLAGESLRKSKPQPEQEDIGA